jgi:hypothetical protein
MYDTKRLNLHVSHAIVKNNSVSFCKDMQGLLYGSLCLAMNIAGVRGDELQLKVEYFRRV